DRAAEHHPELLARMAMLGDDALRIELDDRDRAELAVDRAGEHTVPDRDRADRRELFEPTHGGTVAAIVEGCRRCSSGICARTSSTSCATCCTRLSRGAPASSCRGPSS